MSNDRCLVEVRYNDGYIETYEDYVEFRFGADLLWIKLKNGQNRHIPTKFVRWYAVYPESHGFTPKK